MQAKSRLFKGFVIVLLVLIVLGGGLLALKNLNLGEANEALGGNEPTTYSDENMDIAMTSKSAEVPEGEDAGDDA